MRPRLCSDTVVGAVCDRAFFNQIQRLAWSAERTRGHRPRLQFCYWSYMGKKTLSGSMTETEFDNGYWYVTELREFAIKIGIPSANKLRKDELEKALKHFLRTGELKALAKRRLSKPAVRD